MTSTLKTYLKQVKVISEQILKDKSIQQSYAPEIKEFKNNLTDFINIYPNYMRYDLQNNLMNIFTNILDHYYNESTTNRNIQMTTKILKQYGLEKVKTKYYKELNKYVKGELLKNMQDFSKKLTREDKKLRDSLLKWLKDLKKCRNETCVKDSYYSLQTVLYTPRDDLFYEIEMIRSNHELQYLKKHYELMKNVLNDTKLLQLKTPLQRNLTTDIKRFIKMYEQNTNADNLEVLHDFFLKNITAKYYDNTKINLKDLQHIRSLFDRHGLAKLRLDSEFEFNHFIQYDLKRIFKDFKDALTPKDLMQEKPILEWYENFKKLKPFDERKKAFERLYDLLEE